MSEYKAYKIFLYVIQKLIDYINYDYQINLHREKLLKIILNKIFKKKIYKK